MLDTVHRAAKYLGIESSGAKLVTTFQGNLQEAATCARSRACSKTKSPRQSLLILVDTLSRQYLPQHTSKSIDIHSSIACKGHLQQNLSNAIPIQYGMLSQHHFEA